MKTRHNTASTRQSWLLAGALTVAGIAGADTRFVATGNLNIGRAYHTATLLGSGKVLVVGGQDSNLNTIGQSELYVRAAGGFSLSGSLLTPRYRHTATRLFTGKVLIVGGLDANNNSLASAELYDPVTGTFSASQSSLANPRYNHTAVLLPDGSGKVLIISGIGNAGALASVEVYNSATDTISPGTPLNTGRYFGTSTLISSHGATKILVAGGLDASGNVTASAELYDPTTGQWNYTGSLRAGRYEAADAVLPTGSVLISGGYDASGTPLASAEIYVPDAGVFTPGDSLNIARGQHTETRLTTGKVLVAGGVGTGPPSYPQQAEIFKASGSKRIFAPSDFDVKGKMITGRYGHTATLMANGQVLFAGGVGLNGVGLPNAEIFQSWAAEGGDDDDDCND